MCITKIEVLVESFNLRAADRTRLNINNNIRDVVNLVAKVAMRDSNTKNRATFRLSHNNTKLVEDPVLRFTDPTHQEPVRSSGKETLRTVETRTGAPDQKPSGLTTPGFLVPSDERRRLDRKPYIVFNKLCRVWRRWLWDKWLLGEESHAHHPPLAVAAGGLYLPYRGRAVSPVDHLFRAEN
ncbi:hypothetical protein TSAR_006849 [Trichomalopsis sarcophagae]|uniref:Uncharacterized protein n=1 Tax=Trichomalopsis sarcophagae TaxID=543379 RepID=A0A232F2M4_9HYME|nr:hypothetical protein TSAR_006849 [Trichomalopsis sarcophagae]